MNVKNIQTLIAQCVRFMTCTQNQEPLIAGLHTVGWAAQKFWGEKFGEPKMYDFKRITLFGLEKRLSKHKMTIFSKNLGGWPLWPLWLRLCLHIPTDTCEKKQNNSKVLALPYLFGSSGYKQVKKSLKRR